MLTLSLVQKLGCTFNMKSRLFAILLLLGFEELLVNSSECPAPPILKFNCDEKCTAMLNAFITHSVECTTTAEDLRIQLNATTEKLRTKEALVESINQTIKLLEHDQRRTFSATNGCPSGPSGVYTTELDGLEHFEVPCNEYGWMTIQKRYDGSENFDRSWQDYKDGFGKVTREFFIGLEKIHLMTKSRPHKLYIKLLGFDGSLSYARFDHFEIGNETESYVLRSIGAYSGTAGNSLYHHLNLKFTTFDEDNDNMRGNSASNEFGGWWFGDSADR